MGAGRATLSSCLWAPLATTQPFPMVTKIYHNVHKDTRNKFCNYVKVRIEVELHEFGLEVPGGQIFFPSIRRHLEELGRKTGMLPSWVHPKLKSQSTKAKV